MTTQLLTAWHPKPEALAGCAALLVGYAALARRRGRPLPAWRAVAFASGVAVLLLSLVSPLDTLAHEYLFSAHMAQHLLLTLVVPPLLLLGLPNAERGTRSAEQGRIALRPGMSPTRPVPRSALRVPRSAFVSWFLATGVMWAWHLPVLYNAALASDAVHVAQHGLFLATALLFWWPVFGPAGARAALPAWGAALYLFLAMAAGSILGIILAFAPPGLYPLYLAPPDSHGLLALVRDGWGLTPEDDQQLGGFLMWIPGGIAYSLAMFAVLARWFAEPDEDELGVERGNAARPATSPVEWPGAGRSAGYESRLRTLRERRDRAALAVAVRRGADVE